ncbi:MAG TPA: ABC transporter ATP-binding protein [Acidimicrobiales bacterium]|nr:ABC transporter ATP-binding protein [Acidimicrobiales bacterium]
MASDLTSPSAVDTGTVPAAGPAGPGASAPAGAILSANGISVRFGGLQALQSVDLHVLRGQITGLIGPNGAGKTTMFNVLCGLIAPTEGKVVFDGTTINRWPPHRRGRAGMARTFQRLELFTRMSVEDNLVAAWESSHPGALLGRGRATRKQKVAEVMELVGLERVANRVAGELPTGLGRLVELGRALCTDPRVLLLDEPSSGLDHGETQHFSQILQSVVGGRGNGEPAVLLVEHDMALVMQVCSTITVLDFGRRIAAGTPAEIRADAGVRAAYLGESDVA